MQFGKLHMIWDNACAKLKHAKYWVHHRTLSSEPYSAAMRLQGNCPEQAAKDSKIPDVKSAQLKPGQCVLITPSSTFSVETNFWLDNMYIMQRPGKEPLPTGAVPALVSVADQGKLWATDVTIEGDRVSSQSGLIVLQGAQVFLDGISSLML